MFVCAWRHYEDFQLGPSKAIGKVHNDRLSQCWSNRRNTVQRETRFKESEDTDFWFVRCCCYGFDRGPYGAGSFTSDRDCGRFHLTDGSAERTIQGRIEKDIMITVYFRTDAGNVNKSSEDSSRDSDDLGSAFSRAEIKTSYLKGGKANGLVAAGFTFF